MRGWGLDIGRKSSVYAGVWGEITTRKSNIAHAYGAALEADWEPLE
jgi:hypothetical protein